MFTFYIPKTQFSIGHKVTRGKLNRYRKSGEKKVILHQPSTLPFKATPAQVLGRDIRLLNISAYAQPAMKFVPRMLSVR
jgi:hypothetical protein